MKEIESLVFGAANVAGISYLLHQAEFDAGIEMIQAGRLEEGVHHRSSAITGILFDGASTAFRQGDTSSGLGYVNAGMKELVENQRLLRGLREEGLI